MIIRQRGAELLHIGRTRRYDRASAEAVLVRLSKQTERMGEMRACLATLVPAGQVATMTDDTVVEQLATRIARHEVAFIWLRPPEANAPEIQGEDGPPPEVVALVAEPKKEEPHWIEIELLAEDPPHDPVAGAKYVIELPDGAVIEGYLNEKGKARIDGVKPGQCKVTFPEYAEPDKKGDVVIPKKKDPVAGPPPKEECAIQLVEIECEHGEKRKKKITLPAKDNAPAILEVVGAGKGNGDKITTKIKLLSDPCGDHASKRLVVKTPMGETIQFGEDEATFEAYYTDPSEMSVVRMWPWDEDPDDFKILPQACRSIPKQEMIVRVYPGYEPSVSFTFSMSDKDELVEKKIEQARKRGYVEKRGGPPNTDWTLEIEAKLKYGKRQKSLKAEFEPKLRQIATINRLLKRAIDWFTQTFYKWVRIKVVPEFPKLALEYEGKYKEIDESLRVGTEYTVKLKADPLIGLTFKLDVLGLLIESLKATPLAAVSVFLSKARAWAEKAGTKIEVMLSFSGLIGGDIQAEKKAKNKNPAFDGGIEGKLKVGFSAKAEAKAKFMVSFEFAAEVGADTGISAKLRGDRDSEGIYVKGTLTLLACKFKWSASASGKFIWEVKEAYEDEYTMWDEKDLWESGKGHIFGSLN